MNAHFLVLLIAPLALFSSSCGTNPKNSPHDLAALSHDYVTTAESITSLIAIELGNISGPPTPGALAFKSCMQSQCTLGTDAAAPHAMHFKTARGCETSNGALNGVIYMRVDEAPEFGGCATRSGPFVFRHWPPSNGKLTLAIGYKDLLANDVSGAMPDKTLDRNVSEHEAGHFWGTASLSFNGTSDVDVALDQWLQIMQSGQNSRFHFKTDVPLKLHLESPWDSSARIFAGNFTMTDSSRQTRNTVQLNDLAYNKTRCCHPLSGSLALGVQSTTDSADGASTFILEFSDVCGEAVLHEGLGQSSRIKLVACSS